jgi:hypothetical protein
MERDFAYTNSLDAGRDALETNFEGTAEDIAIKRAEAVVAAFFHMAAVRSLHPGEAAKSKRISCERAHVQLAGAATGFQAAHMLPGQILVDNRLVWDLVPDGTPGKERLQGQLLECFGMVHVLPPAFNRADSMAEGAAHKEGHSNLKSLFGKTVQKMWSTARVDARYPLAIDRKAMMNSLKEWFDTISEIYLDASQRKDDKAQTAQRRGDAARASRRMDEALILTTYARSFKIASVERFVSSKPPLQALSQRYHDLPASSS